MAISVAAGIAEGMGACVGDEPGNSSGTDAGGNGDGSNPLDDGSSGDSGTAKAVAGDQTLYVGNAATVLGDASTPSDGTYAWTVTSVPAGSAITTASLQNANTPAASFTPDVVGDYVLTLSVTTSGGPASNATATVHAAPGKAFYVLAKPADGTHQSTEVHTIRTDGTGDFAITCPLVQTNSTGIFTAEGMSEASGINWIEGAPGDDPKVVFGYQDTLTDGGTVTYIATGLGSSRCDGLHLVGRIDAIPNGALFPSSVQFSPDATRISYLPSDGVNPPTIATIGADGSNKHNGFGSPAVTDAGAPRSINDIAPPRWIDTTHLAWVEYIGTQAWRVMTSADVVSPSPTVYMTCNATDEPFGGGTHQPSIIEFDLLPDGSVLASVQGAADASASALSLVVLKPQSVANPACQFVRQLTSGVSDAVDYALSPDKTKVAFLSSGDGLGGDMSLFVVPVDGSSAPVRVAGSPDGGASEGHGPHWAAGGAWLVWDESAVALKTMGIDAAVSSDNVVGIAAAGGKISPMAIPDASTTAAYAVGNSCAMGSARSPNGLGFGAVGLLLGLVARRRKRVVES